jgi:sugar/nucleoside kinase (ribokinase family)
MLVGILENPDQFENGLMQIMRRANAVGALTTTRRGAIPSLPTREQVDTFLNASG